MGVYVVNVKVTKTVEYSYDLHVKAEDCYKAGEIVSSKNEEELANVAVPSSKLKTTINKITFECKGELNGE